MRYRKYGNLTTEVSEIGFGAWQLGNQIDWSPMANDEAIGLVHTAVDQGCNFFDTAPGYGRGASERLLGEALEGKRDRVVINTKVGHTADGETDFSAAGIRSSVESSLRRLRTSYIDSVLLHNPPEACLYGDSEQMRALQQLKDEGVIRAYGASVDTLKDMEIVLNTSGSHVLEVLFNVFYQETSRAFAQAERQQVGLIIKVPLDSGWLSGKYNEASRFEGVRKRWSDDVIARRADLVQRIRFVEDDGSTMTQAALRFILSYPEVSTIIPGAKSVKQWEENASSSDKKIPEEVAARLRSFWEERLGHDPLPW
ncbi:aryl-alcohol dehydrogenase-like predicted oxidoreductase [Paenibacillus taihuensis]|uniref:Aryl-alcohol dehydrogenase-like predicted oxidoreductase n=1 Tax=Paenibacillus taihuensis TaxID=1156355 RepID=A0A3D9RHU8_9BACL|nr:aldo/keto reductase [Paenibacillus taihuensis]REE78659.1 aryl-alcohol dehydrogenase-like predicted oxidoreductase [Paenibacillus taihuensis]